MTDYKELMSKYDRLNNEFYKLAKQMSQHNISDDILASSISKLIKINSEYAYLSGKISETNLVICKSKKRDN